MTMKTLCKFFFTRTVEKRLTDDHSEDNGDTKWEKKLNSSNNMMIAT